MKKTTLFKTVLLLCALIVGSGSAWADTETVTFSEEYSDREKPTSYEGSNFSIAFSKGSNSNNAPQYYSTGTAMRLYGGNTMTVSSSNTITKIELTFSSGEGSNTISTAPETYDNGTWEGSATSVIFTVGGTKGHRRVSSVKVTYTPAAIPVTSITLNKSVLSLAVGETETLTLSEVLPATATDKTVTWSSSNSSVASVNSSTGEVTANNVGGPVTITATANDGSGVTATCAVTVIAARVDVTGVTLNKTATTLFVGGTETLTATIAPAEATNKNVVWTSSDDAVASVDENGVVTANAVGTATITATSEEDEDIKATCTVTVNPVVVTGVTLNKTSTSIMFGSTETLTATVAPANATNKNVSWTSSNTSVATVSEGVITPVSVGTTTITVTTEDQDMTATCDVTITENTTPSGATPGEITIFYESFDKCNSTGGNDGAWSGLSGNENLDDAYTDNEGWTATNQKKVSSECAYFGSTSKAGDPVSPAISFESDKTYTLSFKAANWGASADKNDGGTLTVKVGTTTLFNAITLNVGGVSGWGTYSESFTGIDGSKTISFTKSSKRFFLDEVKVTQAGTPTVSVTVPSSGWGTYCSAYKLDLSDAATEVQAYAITGYNASEGTITLAKVSGVVPAKTPLVIKGETGSKKIAVSEDSGVTPSNELTGYLSPTYYDGNTASYTAFGMSSGNFHKLTAGTIPANRAVLFMPTSEAGKIPAEARLTFIFDEEGETTGVKTIEKRQVTIDGYYNLNGQRVAQPTKGLYIVNGRKVVIK